MYSFPMYCNYCYRRRSLEPNLEVFVSNCGHVVCSSCLNNQCPICSKAFSGIAINSEMPEGLSDYFDDPLKLLRHFQKVTKFQYIQERILSEHLSAFNAEEEKRAKDEQRKYVKIQQSLQRKLDKENDRTRKCEEYIAYHERRLEQSRYMTPPTPAQPRPRYPARKGASGTPMACSTASEINFMPQLTKSVQAKFPPPRSPTMSTNDDTSIRTGDDSISKMLHQMSQSFTLQSSPEETESKVSFQFPK